MIPENLKSFRSQYQIDETSAKTDKIIRVVSNGINNYFNKYHPSLRKPVIAGGAIRDYFFGLMPKDYDIFFDISDMDENEGDDAATILAYELKDYLGNDFKKYDTFRVDFLAYEKLTNKGKAFSVYNLIGPEENNPDLQLIVCNSDLQDPSVFIEDFDYELVKCYFDPSTMSYTFSEAFQEALKKEKPLSCSNLETKNRISVFQNRLSKKNPSVKPFEIQQYEKLLKTNKTNQFNVRYRLFVTTEVGF